MVKIGIILSDANAVQWVKYIKNVQGFELTGWNNASCEILDTSSLSGLIAYPTLEALFNYVDAVVISCQMENAFTIIGKCLKHFKHVFLTEAHHLRYADFNYLLKIAEESNVSVYPEFGGFDSETLDHSAFDVHNIQFIDLNHTFHMNESLCVGGRLSQALLRDIDFITHFIKANIKKINANAWGFCEPGTGMLHAKIDFDNGASANLLLVNSPKPRHFQMAMYGKNETVRINLAGSTFNITREPLNRGTICCEENEFLSEWSFSKELKLFLSLILQEHTGMAVINRKYQSFRITHLIQEKINHISAINIFYS